MLLNMFYSVVAGAYSLCVPTEPGACRDRDTSWYAVVEIYTQFYRDTLLSAELGLEGKGSFRGGSHQLEAMRIHGPVKELGLRGAGEGGRVRAHRVYRRAWGGKEKQGL